MARKRHTPEQILAKLREVEVARGRTAGEVCRKIGVTGQTHDRCREEYGGLRLDWAKRLAEQALDNAILKEVASGNLQPDPGPWTGAGSSGLSTHRGWGTTNGAGSRNADGPRLSGRVPLPGLDVREHAYDLEFQNARERHVEALLSHLASWRFASQNLEMYILTGNS
ncbi:MAG: Fe-Mn family superoxide dismutase [Planctomycetota bacterium]|jgi:hypothetical protein